MKRKRMRKKRQTSSKVYQKNKHDRVGNDATCHIW